jgi:hypothetical protein
MGNELGPAAVLSDRAVRLTQKVSNENYIREISTSRLSCFLGVGFVGRGASFRGLTTYLRYQKSSADLQRFRFSFMQTQEERTLFANMLLAERGEKTSKKERHFCSGCARCRCEGCMMKGGIHQAQYA